MGTLTGELHVAYSNYFFLEAIILLGIRNHIHMLFQNRTLR